MSDGDSVASLRNAQLALLSLAAVTLLMATTTPATQERLVSARDELERWPTQGAVLTSAVSAVVPSSVSSPWALDVPRDITAGWMVEHLGGDGRLTTNLLSSLACDKPAATTACALDLANEQALGCQVQCAVAALWEGPDGPRRGGSVKLLRVYAVDNALNSELETRIEARLTALRRVRERVAAQLRGAAALCQSASDNQRLYSSTAPSAQVSTKGCTGARAALASSIQARTAAWEAVQALPQDILVRSDELAKLIQANGGGRDLVGEVRVDGVSRYITLNSAPVRYSLAARAPTGTGVVAALADIPAVGNPWSKSAVVDSGVWSDVKQLEIPVAQALLHDRVADAQLHGEVLGISLSASDALRAVWLPLLALSAYSVWLLARFWGSLRRDKTSDWPVTMMSQTLFHFVAGLAVAVSVSCASENAACARGMWLHQPQPWVFAAVASTCLWLMLRTLSKIADAPRLGRATAPCESAQSRLHSRSSFTCCQNDESLPQSRPGSAPRDTPLT